MPTAHTLLYKVEANPPFKISLECTVVMCKGGCRCVRER